jgi:hypothetical protein
MSRLAIAFGFLLSTLAICMFSGCGTKGPERLEVSGRVIFKDQPLDEGIIEFEPLDGQGTKSGAIVTKGEYQIPRDKGLSPGRYKVTIVAGDGVSGSGKAEPTSPPPGATPGKERIPPEFNVKSNVVREVTKDKPNKFDFKIS